MKIIHSTSVQGLILKYRDCLHELWTKGYHSMLNSPAPKGWLPYLHIKPGQAVLHRVVVSLSAEMLH